jgi:S-layer homology domain/PsbP-like protein
MGFWIKKSSSKKGVWPTPFPVAGMALALFLGGLGLNQVFAKFTDVPTDQANAEAVAYVQSQKIVEGYPDGTFRPDSTLTRAELAKILIGSQFSQEAIDHCVQDNSKPGWTYLFFPDVPIKAWFAKYVCVGKINGILAGYPDGTFRPSQDVDFAEASKVLGEWLRVEPAKDVPWYKPIVETLAEKKAIPVTIEAFDQKLTRGELAEIVYRLKTGTTNKDSTNYETILALSSEWQSFKNDKYGFEIRVPQGWKVRADGFPNTMTFYSEELGIADNGCGVFQKSANEQDVTQWYGTYYQQQKKGTQDKGLAFSLPSPTLFRPFPLNGIIAIKAHGVSLGEKTQTQIYLIHGNDVFSCQYPDSDPSDVDFANHLTLYKKAASTFLFTQTGTSDWKTFGTTRYGYTIGYPSNWTLDSIHSENGFTRRGLPGSKVYIGGETAFTNYPDPASFGPGNPAPKDFLSLDLSIYQIDPTESYAKFVSDRGYGSGKRTAFATNAGGAFRLSTVSAEGSAQVITLFKKGNAMFDFSYGGNPIPQAGRQIADQIIGSFGFKASSAGASTTGTADWQTYKNEKYGYAIAYPSGWVSKEKTDASFEQKTAFNPDGSTSELDQAMVGVLSVDLKTYLDSFDKNPNLKKIQALDEVPIGNQQGPKTTYQNLATNDVTSIYSLALNGKTIVLAVGGDLENAFVASFLGENRSEDWKTYKNDIYGFSLTFDDLWRGVQVIEKKPATDSAQDYLYLCVPTTSKSWTDLQPGVFCPLSLIVVSADKWEAYKTALQPFVPMVAGKNDKTVFAVSKAQDHPADGGAVMDDVDNLLATFKLAQPPECVADPVTDESGHTVYPIAKTYENVKFLGQLFTAADCGPDRLGKIYGVKGDEYQLGSSLLLSKDPSADLVADLKAVGYACHDTNPETSCRQWELAQTVKTESLLGLKTFMDYFKSDACFNCQ